MHKVWIEVALNGAWKATCASELMRRRAPAIQVKAQVE